jgi:hypothetical protein
MDELYKHALTALQNWTAGWRRALERLKRLAQQASAPPWWETNAGDLVTEAYRAGLRDWLSHALGADALVDGPDDLRLWCRLQAKALKICRDAYPVHFCYWQRALYDKDLLREAMPLLVEPEAHAGDPLKQFAWLKSFECIDTSILPLYWDTQHNREEEVDAVPIPDPPGQGEYQELTRRAWGYVRSVAWFAGQPPPEEPGQVQDETGFRSALHHILIWCGKLEKKQSSGGAGAPQVPCPEKDLPAGPAGRDDEQSRSGPALSQPTAAGGVGEGGEAALHEQGGSKPRKKGIPKEEAEILVRDHLKAHPSATVKEIHEATGVSTGSIANTSAWKGHQAKKELADTSPGRAPRTRPLTNNMLAARGQEDDPSSRMEAEEIVWRYLIENATPEERERLNALKPAERAEYIRTVRQQLEDQQEDDYQPEE